MKKSSKKIGNNQKIFLIILICFVVFSQSVYGFYAIYDLDPPGSFTLLSFFGIFWLIGDWFKRDSKENNVNWAFDMGFFLYISWPVFIPFYLLKTRGFKVAATTTFGFIALCIGSYFLSYYIFYAIMPDN